MTPIPLRTVRPFVLDEVCLSDAAEEGGFDLNDRMEISKFLRAKVNISTHALPAHTEHLTT